MLSLTWMFNDTTVTAIQLFFLNEKGNNKKSKTHSDLKGMKINPLLRPWSSSTQRRFPPKFIKTVIKAIQSTFRSPEIHSKRRYKIFVSVFGHPRTT